MSACAAAENLYNLQSTRKILNPPNGRATTSIQVVRWITISQLFH